MILSNNLKPGNNSMAAFYPVNTTESKNEFSWDLVTSLFLSELYGLVSNETKFKKFENELLSFQQECESEFISILSDGRAWERINKIYFTNNNVAKITPKLRIFSLVKDANSFSTEKRVLSFLRTLFQKNHIYHNDVSGLNFIEQIFNDFFEKKFPTNAPIVLSTISYLPKLSNIFAEDLKFLTGHSKYFLENIQIFLELYFFIYTTQLSININGWQETEPRIKECFFILDTERASRERGSLQKGYKLVEKNLDSIFPTLALAESLQCESEKKIPLWELYTQLSENDFEPLLKYCDEFAQSRNLEKSTNHFDSNKAVLSELQRLFKAQFNKDESRHQAGLRVVNTIKKTILNPFTEKRGSAGNIFVLNQENLLLLTNLVIGNREKLRLYEILKEFEKRGIFFDKESCQALVEFYERLGNVEKMSDSGDAIYVKKTI